MSAAARGVAKNFSSAPQQQEQDQQPGSSNGRADEPAHSSPCGPAAAGSPGAPSPAAPRQQQAPMGAPQLVTSEFLSCQPPSGGGRLYLVLLNWHLPHATARLWSAASLRISVDGGCNRLYDQPLSLESSAAPSTSSCSASPPSASADADARRAAFKPDLILGDLDSIRPEVRAFYTGLGVPLHDLSHDQMTTDMHKSIAHLDAVISGRPPSERHQIVVLGAIGGRLDHTLSNLSTLHAFAHLDIALWGEANLVRLLRAGTAHIAPDRRFEGPMCGVVPLAGPATASSTGLLWDMDGTALAVGALVSTSNRIEADLVTVTSDVNVVWTVEVDEAAHALAGQTQR